MEIYTDSVRNVEPEIKIVIEPEDVVILSEDSIFSKKDVEYIKKQIDKNKDFKIDKSRIALPTEFISQSELDQILKRRSNYKEKEYVNFSVPLFNLKKDKCLIKVESCGIQPPGCGGSITVLQKKDGRWDELTNISSWVN